MENNWIDLFSTCIILFMFLLLFIAVTLMMQQVNIWRNERSMHKRLDIRHKREMEAELKISEIAVKPIIFKHESFWPQHLINEYFHEDLDRNRVISNVMSHFEFELRRCLEVELSEPIYDRGNRRGDICLTAKLGIIPKEHINLFK